MRLHRFFCTNIIAYGALNHCSNPSLTHQLSHVFRLHSGDIVIFFDGTGVDYECELVSLEKSQVTFRAVKKHVVKPQSDIKVTLALSLIKKDNVEWVIQKGTEIGVSEFIPLISERSEKKGFNKERAEKIMIEALEQSGRSDMVTIAEPQTLSDFLKNEKRKLIVFHTEGDVLKDVGSPVVGVVLCIGPEGGWSEKEVKMFTEKGATIVRINTPILRAETAAVVAATLFLVK